MGAMTRDRHHSFPGRAVLGALSRVVRLPLLVVLVILRPVITFALAALALLGVLTTLFLKLSGTPDFPFWTMMMISAGFAIALLLYDALIEVLSTP